MAFWPTAVLLVIFLYSIHRWSLCHKTERESQIPLPYASHFFLFWNMCITAQFVQQGGTPFYDTRGGTRMNMKYKEETQHFLNSDQ